MAVICRPVGHNTIKRSGRSPNLLNYISMYCVVEAIDTRKVRYEITVRFRIDGRSGASIVPSHKAP